VSKWPEGLAAGGYSIDEDDPDSILETDVALALARVILILAEALDSPKFIVLPRKLFSHWNIGKK
jgi:hypothetical protein